MFEEIRQAFIGFLLRLMEFSLDKHHFVVKEPRSQDILSDYPIQTKRIYLEEEPILHLPLKEVLKTDRVKVRLILRAIDQVEAGIKDLEYRSGETYIGEEKIILRYYQHLYEKLNYRLNTYILDENDSLTKIEQAIQGYREQIEANDLSGFLENIKGKYEEDSNYGNQFILVSVRVQRFEQEYIKGIYNESYVSLSKVGITLACLDLLNEYHRKCIEEKISRE